MKKKNVRTFLSEHHSKDQFTHNVIIKKYHIQDSVLNKKSCGRNLKSTLVDVQLIYDDFKHCARFHIMIKEERFNDEKYNVIQPAPKTTIWQMKVPCVVPITEC